MHFQPDLECCKILDTFLIILLVLSGDISGMSHDTSCTLQVTRNNGISLTFLMTLLEYSCAVESWAALNRSL